MKHEKNISKDHLHLMLTVICLAAGVSFLLSLIIFPDITRGYTLGENIDWNRAAEHLEVLSSREHGGRLSGSPGNRKSLAYASDQFKAMGLAPWGDDNGYLQHFSGIVPDMDTSPDFRITVPDSPQVLQFQMYEDYSVHSAFYGTGIDFSGDILICSRTLNSYPRELLENRLIIAPRTSYMPPSLETARAAGAAGVFFTAAANWYGARDVNKPSEKQISIHRKLGTDFFSGDIRPAAVARLKQLATEVEHALLVPGASIAVELNFPVASSANVLALLPARSRSAQKQSGGA